MQPNHQLDQVIFMIQELIQNAKIKTNILVFIPLVKQKIVVN